MSYPAPLQLVPLAEEAGLTHVLFFVWYPPPQVELHAVQLLQEAHCSSMESFGAVKIRIVSIFLECFYFIQPEVLNKDPA